LLDLLNQNSDEVGMQNACFCNFFMLYSLKNEPFIIAFVFVCDDAKRSAVGPSNNNGINSFVHIIDFME
jgi:hypothetical protein